ncbi:NTF2-like protein [Daldinia decipiens]|uniref:NTF2-like protein n=1 Tax=Daldinia decipiens TaxID=326647 RepID=UPI0020C1D451|nr:NTF2-like protein [Daldinia decipiens]KAI1656653.1 NTF2-like protein [Daldinia decipiens]
MAPSGPRKGSAPTGPRNTRGGANGANAASRGGISKRRSNASGRVDKDGDLDMDVPGAANRNARKAKRTEAHDPTTTPRSTRSAPNGSRAPRPNVKTQQIIQRVFNGTGGSLSSRIATGMSAGAKAFKGTRQVNAPNTMTLQVQGLKSSKAAGNEGGGLKELLTFLERKAQAVSKTIRNIRIKKSHINGDFVYIITSKEDGEEILKLNGFAFAGTTLTITEVSGELPPASQNNMSSTALEVKDALRNVLSLRYDGSAKLLNLSALGEDAGLNQMGFFSGESKPEKLFRALMAVCDGLFKTAQDKRDAVVSVSLAGNNIDDVFQIMSLTETFPDLVNLDLSRNHFKDLKGLQKWRYRLRKLETLLLNDNPIETANPNYAAELINWFPRLQNLSGIQVRTPEQVAAMEAASRPTPIPQHGADFRDINGIGEAFIREFMSMYDVDRHNLAAKYYDNESTFSIAVINSSPHPQNIQTPGWGGYIKFSRNHNKITHTSTRIQRLFVGTHLIQSAWQQLPPTRHPDLVVEFNKYIVDCHPVHGLPDPAGQSPVGVDGMVITIHGEFEDQEPGTMKTAKRSFSRTFVLGPGAPGRNPIRVISDMLSVRAFNPPPGSTPEPTAQPIAQPIAQPDAELQQQMVIELCKRTGMTPEYSKFCLDGANWNFDQALLMFNEKRAQLPANAFVTTSQ